VLLNEMNLGNSVCKQLCGWLMYFTYVLKRAFDRSYKYRELKICVTR